MNDVSFSVALGGLVDPVGKIGLGKSVIANGGVRLQEPHRGTIGFKG